MWRISPAANASEVRPTYTSGLARTTTRAPSTSGGCTASSTRRGQVTETLTLADGSRRVRKDSPWPGRRVSSATWPSTHTSPSRAIQPAISCEACRTGIGCSAEVCSAMGRSLGGPPSMVG